jgi:Flp pilus assembly protein TadG
MMRRLVLRLRDDQRGNSLIEMALVAPLLGALVVGTLDISDAVSEKLALEQSAQRVVEYVQRSGYQTSDNAALIAEAKTAAGAGSTASVTAWLECNGNGVHLNFDTGTCSNASVPYARYAEITVRKTFTPQFGTRFFPGANADGTVNVSATAGVRVQ